jgi:L-lysine exporter family protein LysE/ArgO
LVYAIVVRTLHTVKQNNTEKMFTVFAQGFGTSAALIIAIGAQNAFVLRQGLKREHVFTVALICALSDAFLITLGVAGVGKMVQQTPLLLSIARYGGAAFLIAYGAFALKRALAQKGESLVTGNVSERTSLKQAVLACLAFTYLNPHCYLDTIVLLGGLSGQYEGGQRWYFGAGALSASVVWFFSLAYGARLLAPLFAKPIAWRILDGLIALVMFAIAFSLLNG